MKRPQGSRRSLATWLVTAAAGAIMAGEGHAQGAIELDTITVTIDAPSPIAAPEGRTFQSVTLVTEDEIARTSGATIADRMFTRPGITASTFAPGASRPIIRGLDNFRVRIQENGIGSHDVSALSEDHGVAVDPLAAQKIEILRGPATLRWGSQAIGGTVHVENNRIPRHKPPQGISVASSGAYTSVDDGGEGALAVEAGVGPFALHVDAHRRKAEDYRIPRAPGRQENTAVEQDGYAAGGSFLFERGFIGVSFANFASEYGIPGEEAAERQVMIDLNQDKVLSMGEYRPASSVIERMRYWFGYSDYKHDEIATEEGVREIGSTFINKEREGRVELEHRHFDSRLGRVQGAFGVHLRQRDLSAAGEGGELLAPNETESAAVFVFEELALSQAVRLQAAGRIEHVDVAGTAALFPAGFVPPPDEPDEARVRRSFDPASASFGVLYDWQSGIVLGVNAQYAERAPDTLELFAKGPHEATGTFETGDSRLDIETARVLELSARRTTGRLRFDVAGFYTRYGGFIHKRFSGLECNEDFASCGAPDPDEEILTQIVYAQQDAEFYGMEASAEWDVVDLWRGVVGFDGQYDVVRARFTDGTNVPRITPQRAGAGVYYRDATYFARLGVLHVFEQNRVAMNETPTPDYTLLEAEMAYRLNEHVAFGIKGSNLLDDEVRNHVSFKKDEVLLPGRSVRVYGRVVF